VARSEPEADFSEPESGAGLKSWIPLSVDNGPFLTMRILFLPVCSPKGFGIYFMMTTMEKQSA
jgi:hypothetical protein